MVFVSSPNIPDPPALFSILPEQWEWPDTVFLVASGAILVYITLCTQEVLFTDINYHSLHCLSGFATIVCSVNSGVRH